MDFLDRLIDLALLEDVGPGDLTSEALIPEGAHGRAVFLCKERMVLAGTEAARRTFRAVDPSCQIRFHVEEGRVIEPGSVFGTVDGPVRALLVGERTALNFLQRLCGIATLTRRYVEALEGGKLQLLDTRKTIPGHRVLEKAAVRAGGARNHRFALYDGVLIKDNHLAAVGSIEEAIRLARLRAPSLTKIEVEVEDVDGARRAAEAGADVILLDNMGDETIAEAVRAVAGRALVEISGGITFERLPRLAATGADFVSAGAITHQARAVDISLDLEAAGA
ncbi:carboxylating nicotinate-nucleotide diphosphorylase [Vulgatibacter sp.]|uniref:carboxylating nicotinate-nucleotide diphosphorylase n=1 Tax=Vulgatibacter sp. TaxID=1971226 RepID=UPI003563B1ED